MIVCTELDNEFDKDRDKVKSRKVILVKTKKYIFLNVKSVVSKTRFLLG